MANFGSETPENLFLYFNCFGSMGEEFFPQLLTLKWE